MRTTCPAALSSRSPRNTACRNRPPPDQPANATSITNSGRTQLIAGPAARRRPETRPVPCASGPSSPFTAADPPHRTRCRHRPRNATRQRVEISQMQRAEADAVPPGGVHPSTTNSSRCPALHLHPVPAAPAAIGASGLLADDPLQTSVNPTPPPAKLRPASPLHGCCSAASLPTVQSLQNRLSVRSSQRRKSQPSSDSRSNAEHAAPIRPGRQRRLQVAEVGDAIVRSATSSPSSMACRIPNAENAATTGGSRPPSPARCASSTEPAGVIERISR